MSKYTIHVKNTEEEIDESVEAKSKDDVIKELINYIAMKLGDNVTVSKDGKVTHE